jgi:hypothetical protein
MDEGKGQPELAREDIEGGDEEEGGTSAGLRPRRARPVGASSLTIEIFSPPARRMSSPIERSGNDPDGLPKAPKYRGMVVEGVKKQTRAHRALAGAGRVRALCMAHDLRSVRIGRNHSKPKGRARYERAET